VQTVKFGSKELGECEVVVLSAEWVEKPHLDSKFDKYTSYKSLYLEVNQDTLKEIDRFYAQQVQGDLIEGRASNHPYYRILGAKYSDGTFKCSMGYEELVEHYRWDVYKELPEEFMNVSILVEVL
jgi:hypothetical protein